MEMRNNKIPGEDDIAIKAIKEGGDTLTLFGNYTVCGFPIPTTWSNAIITIMHKKGDITTLGNYRPISSL